MNPQQVYKVKKISLFIELFFIYKWTIQKLAEQLFPSGQNIIT